MRLLFFALEQIDLTPENEQIINKKKEERRKLEERRKEIAKYYKGRYNDYEYTFERPSKETFEKVKTMLKKPMWY